MPQGWFQISPQELWPWLVIAGGAVALAVTLLLVSLIARKRDSQPMRHAAPLTPAQQRTLERDVSNLIAALSEMAQQVGSQLDDRAVRLERLIHAADDRIDRLEQLQHETQIDRRPIAAPVVMPSDSTGAETDPRHAEVYSLADQGMSVAEIAQRLSRPKGEVELILALRPRRAG